MEMGFVCLVNIVFVMVRKVFVNKVDGYVYLLVS